MRRQAGVCPPLLFTPPLLLPRSPPPQMFIDGLPIWGFIGKVEKLPSEVAGERERDKLSLFTHIHFEALYNGDRVVQVDISTGEGGVGWGGGGVEDAERKGRGGDADEKAGGRARSGSGRRGGRGRADGQQARSANEAWKAGRAPAHAASHATLSPAPYSASLPPSLSPPLPAPPTRADPTKTVDISTADKANVQFTYSVAWKPTDIPYERRMDKCVGPGARGLAAAGRHAAQRRAAGEGAAAAAALCAARCAVGVWRQAWACGCRLRVPYSIPLNWSTRRSLPRRYAKYSFLPQHLEVGAGSGLQLAGSCPVTCTTCAPCRPLPTPARLELLGSRHGPHVSRVPNQPPLIPVHTLRPRRSTGSPSSTRASPCCC